MKDFKTQNMRRKGSERRGGECFKKAIWKSLQRSCVMPPGICQALHGLCGVLVMFSDIIRQVRDDLGPCFVYASCREDVPGRLTGRTHDLVISISSGLLGWRRNCFGCIRLVTVVLCVSVSSCLDCEDRSGVGSRGLDCSRGAGPSLVLLGV